MTNPLLGVPPETTETLLEKLEDLARGPHRDLDNHGVFQLTGAWVGMKCLRWPFLSYEDNLVHSIMAQHGTHFWGREGAACPVEAITECGLYARLKAQNVRAGLYDTGEVAGSQHLTCIRCLSDVDTEGHAARQVQKMLNFNEAYGGYRFAGTHPGRMSSNGPNISNPPRTARRAPKFSNLPAPARRK